MSMRKSLQFMQNSCGASSIAGKIDRNACAVVVSVVTTRTGSIVTLKLESQKKSVGRIFKEESEPLSIEFGVSGPDSSSSVLQNSFLNS